MLLNECNGYVWRHHVTLLFSVEHAPTMHALTTRGMQLQTVQIQRRVGPWQSTTVSVGQTTRFLSAASSLGTVRDIDDAPTSFVCYVRTLMGFTGLL